MMMTSLRESGLTILTQLQRRYALLWRLGVATAVCCVDVKETRAGTRVGMKLSEDFKLLGGFPRWDVWASRCDGAARRASPSGRLSAAREVYWWQPA